MKMMTEEAMEFKAKAILEEYLHIDDKKVRSLLQIVNHTRTVNGLVICTSHADKL